MPSLATNHSHINLFLRTKYCLVSNWIGTHYHYKLRALLYHFSYHHREKFCTVHCHQAVLLIIGEEEEALLPMALNLLTGQLQSIVLPLKRQALSPFKDNQQASLSVDKDETIYTKTGSQVERGLAFNVFFNSLVHSPCQD